MAEVAIVLGEHFEDKTFETPHTTLFEEGHVVDVISTQTERTLHGKGGVLDYVADLPVATADPDQYDALVIPGGDGPAHLSTDARMVAFVRAVAARGVPVAAIGHAGTLLIEADLVAGRTLTSWPSIAADLTDAGAHWVDEEVVVDGTLITSRSPEDLPAFCRTLLDHLGSPAAPVT